MKIFAHRGIHDHQTKENSRAALEKIYDSKADGIEIDLRLTKDGICVLSHDTKSQSNLRISRHTFDQLSSDVSNIIPITEAMDILRDYSGIINLEIKHIFGERDQKLGQQCIKVLARDKEVLFKSLESNILISSFSRSNISSGASLLREIPRALLIARPKQFTKSIEKALLGDCEAIHLSLQQTRSKGFEDFVDQAHEAKLKVRVFTVNEESEFIRLKNAKVDGVYTDHVDRLVALNE